MKTLTRKEAAEHGYTSITTDVVIGSDIAKSMESTLCEVDAVWIKTGPFHCQVGRKRSNLKQAE